MSTRSTTTSNPAATPVSAVDPGRNGGGLSFDDLHKNEKLIWTQPDGARVFVKVSRLTPHTAWLRCYYGNRAWTRTQTLPLFPSIKRGHWTEDDVAEEAKRHDSQ